MNNHHTGNFLFKIRRYEVSTKTKSMFDAVRKIVPVFEEDVGHVSICKWRKRDAYK